MSKHNDIWKGRDAYKADIDREARKLLERGIRQGILRRAIDDDLWAARDKQCKANYEAASLYAADVYTAAKPPRDTAKYSARKASKSDGSTASYYELPKGCTELQHLISYRDMNAQIGEMFRALYRYGKASHSDKDRDLRKVIYYAEAELARLVAVEKGIHPEEEIKGRL